MADLLTERVDLDALVGADSAD